MGEQGWQEVGRQDGLKFWPWCATCDRPVERVARWQDPLSETYHFRYECHGGLEHAEVTAVEVEDGWVPGLRFVPVGECKPDEKS